MVKRCYVYVCLNKYRQGVSVRMKILLVYVRRCFRFPFINHECGLYADLRIDSTSGIVFSEVYRKAIKHGLTTT